MLSLLVLSQPQLPLWPKIWSKMHEHLLYVNHLAYGYVFVFIIVEFLLLDTTLLKPKSYFCFIWKFCSSFYHFLLYFNTIHRFNKRTDSIEEWTLMQGLQRLCLKFKFISVTNFSYFWMWEFHSWNVWPLKIFWWNPRVSFHSPGFQNLIWNLCAGSDANSPLITNYIQVLSPPMSSSC